MVNKMKLKFSLAILFSVMGITTAEAVDVRLEPILNTEVIRCGSDLSVKSFAYQEDGEWKGFDADLCRAFAWAIYGDGSKFEMVDVRPYNVGRYLKGGLIDVMLSGGVFSAGFEGKQQAEAIGLLYYDRQKFAAKDAPEDAKSMEAFKGKRVCVSTDSDYLDNLKEYNRKYNLDLKILPFNSPDKARKAFFLKRCDLITSRGMLLEGMLMDSPAAGVEILPEEFAYKPVYAFVSQDNNRLRVALKWAINALYLTEELGINQNNISILIGNEDISTRNLLGDDDLLWLSLGLRPQWVRQAVGDLGNMGEIYERNLGADSPIKLERGQANLIKNGGVVHAEKFR